MSSEVQPVFYVLSEFNTFYFVVDFVVDHCSCHDEYIFILKYNMF